MGSSTNESSTYEDVYEAFGGYVRICIVMLLAEQRDLIDDATQEAWIKIWLAYPPRHTSNLKGWLAVIAINTVRDMMRRAKVRLFHYPSLEGFLESSETHEDTNSHFSCADPQATLPESLDRRVLIAHTWTECRPCDRQVLADYTNNRPVAPRALYAARRNFKAKYHRYEQRMEATE